MPLFHATSCRFRPHIAFFTQASAGLLTPSRSCLSGNFHSSSPLSTSCEFRGYSSRKHPLSYKALTGKNSDFSCAPPPAHPSRNSSESDDSSASAAISGISMPQHAPTATEGAVDAATGAPKSAPGLNCVRKLLAEDPVGGWDKAWQASTTPWDLGGVTPAVAAMVAAGEGSPLHLPPAIRSVLVPGCGTGYDVEAFASNGRQATGLDISSSAVAHAEKRVEGAANRAAMAFVCADFFKYRPDQPFDAIFDYTFFCALPPSLRPKWAAKTAELLAADGALYTLMFPIDGHEGGPPFAVSKASYAEVLEPLGFTVEDLPTVSPPPRQGKEQLARWVRVAPAAKV